MGDALAVALSVERDFKPEDFARFPPSASLGRKLLTRVADVMHKENLPICSPQDSFRDVVHVINRGRLGLALVMQGQELNGLITDGDVRRTFDANHDCKALIAAQIMSTDPKSVFPHMSFTDAEDLMRACNVNALVVKVLTGQLAGVLQIFDINTE